MKKMMTPAQVAAKIGHAIKKNEDILNFSPVGPRANTARINLNRAQAALASLQETNEGMRIGKQPQAQMGAPIPNDMNYMQARYGGYTKPEYAEGGPTGEPLSKETLTPALQDMLNLLVSDYGWTEQNALLGLSVAHKESKGLPKSEMDYSGTSNARIRKIFGSRVPASEEELTALKADPDAFFEKVYGVDSSKGSTLGNTEPGDGNKFRGRGLIQITGRANYAAASKAIFGDENILLDNPDLLMEPDTAGKVGAWWVGDKAKNGIKDFDVTQDIPAENVQNFLNGVYSEVSSAGTGSTQAYRDNLGLDKDGQMNSDSIYHAGMGRMQSFVNQVLPNLNWDEDETTPSEEVDNSNDVSNANSLMLADPVEEEAVYDETPGEAPPEAVANFNDASRNQKFENLDLNFRGALDNGRLPEYTSNNKFAYVRNEHGDYNVYNSDTGEYSLVRGENMLPELIGSSEEWNKAIATNGIVYDPAVDGFPTSQDKKNMFKSDFGLKTYDSETQQQYLQDTSIGRQTEIGVDEMSQRLGSRFGDQVSFDQAVTGNLLARGLTEPTWRERANLNETITNRNLWDEDLKERMKVAEANAKVWDEAYAKEFQVAAANPGTYKYTLRNDSGAGPGGSFANAVQRETANSWLGQAFGLDEDYAERSAQTQEYQGVAGYSPFSDYVSLGLSETAEAAYEAGDITKEEYEKAQKEAVGYQTNRQITNRTNKLVGNAVNPGAVSIYGSTIAGSGAGINLDKNGLLQINKNWLKSTGDDAAGAITTRGRNTITGNAQARIGSGSGKLGVTPPPPSPVSGAQDILETGAGLIDDAAVMTNPYQPNLQQYATRGPKGRFTGSKVGDVFKKGPSLGESTLGVSDDFAETMGQGVDDFFGPSQGARLSGKGRALNPGTYTNNIPPNGNLPALRNLPAVRNLPATTPKLPALGGGRGLALNNPAVGLTPNAASLGINSYIPSAGVVGDQLHRQRAMDRIRLKPVEERTEEEKAILEGEVTPTPEGGEKKDNVNRLLDDLKDRKVFDDKDWNAGEPDTYNLDMGNPSALMAIPGLASLASARMQGRALENMQGPPKPITTMMPQFNYKSNIGQQLQEVKDASNAVMQNTSLQGQQAAALNQQVMAQRLKSNSGLLQQDAQQEQAARARYDAMSTQVRMSNDALRNSYLQDSTNFKNKKEMLQASARQQPLNVLASSAQDYLQNVYKSNLAAQMEAVGRPYDTGYDAEGNWIGYKNKD